MGAKTDELAGVFRRVDRNAGNHQGKAKEETGQVRH